MPLLDPDEIRALPTAEDRARAAGELCQAYKAAVELRDAAMIDLLRGGSRPFEVAGITGVSQSQMTRYTRAAGLSFRSRNGAAHADAD